MLDCFGTLTAARQLHEQALTAADAMFVTPRRLASALTTAVQQVKSEASFASLALPFVS